LKLQNNAKSNTKKKEKIQTTTWPGQSHCRDGKHEGEKKSTKTTNTLGRQKSPK